MDILIFEKKEQAEAMVNGAHRVLTGIERNSGIKGLGINFNPAWKLYKYADAELLDEEQAVLGYTEVFNKCKQAIEKANQIVIDFAKDMLENNRSYLNGKSDELAGKLRQAQESIGDKEKMKTITNTCAEVIQALFKAQEAAERQREKQLNRGKYLQERLQTLQGKLKEVNKDLREYVEGILMLPELSIEKNPLNLDQFEMLVGAAEKYFESTKSVLFGKL